ncbi:hypothetical protein MR781_11810 [bacterium]|nr:hypothetical protein [bacterium]MDY4504618.1 hypothetical protein [Bariatricus sp.]
MKKMVSFVTALVLCASSSLPVFAATPKYSISMPKIPQIHVELSDSVKEAVNQAAKKQIEKMILDKPELTSTTYRHKGKIYGTYSFLKIEWGEVEGATSYKVEITKPDGTKKTYETTKAYLSVKEGSDDFITECPKQKTENGVECATVRVRAYGEDETYSAWSEEERISCNAIHS